MIVDVNRNQPGEDFHRSALIIPQAFSYPFTAEVQRTQKRLKVDRLKVFRQNLAFSLQPNNLLSAVNFYNVACSREVNSFNILRDDIYLNRSCGKPEKELKKCAFGV
jgi:hypothetical protein